jgi:hypothetical protein
MKTSAKSVSVNATELLNAFEFVSAGLLYEHSAAICIDTGRIYLASSMIEAEQDLPEDLETSDRYIAVPHKNELGLGRDLALSFIDRELPGDYNTAAGFFRRKGAYGRFKQLLQSRSMLQRWYDFESSATEEALRAWCEENGIEVVGA